MAAPDAAETRTRQRLQDRAGRQPAGAQSAFVVPSSRVAGVDRGGPAPCVSGVGIGADTDNTGDTVDAWFSDLTFNEGP